MKASIVAGFLFTAQAMGQTLEHQPVQQNTPVPQGWVVAPKLMLDISRNVPVVFVGQGRLTTITFPKEVAWCSQKNNLFTHRIKGRPSSPDGDDSNGQPFTEIDLLTKPEGVEAVRNELAAFGRSEYDAEPVNMNCRFTSGEVLIVMLKLSQRPYLSVEFTMPGGKRDYSVFKALARGRNVEKAEIKTAPFAPEADSPLPARRESDSLVVEATKRDYSLFRAAYGSKRK